MKAKVNKRNYKISEVEEIKKNTLWGQCDYAKGKILLQKSLTKTHKKSVLIHELTHAFLYENAHNDKKYGEEKVCDLFGSFAEDIMTITNKYFKE